MGTAWAEELKAAISAVTQASLVCRSVQRQLAPEALSKKDKSPVTVADFSSQAVVCKVLEESFPRDPMIAEEDSAALREPENAPFQQQIVRFLAEAGIEADFEQICRWIDRGNALDYSPRFWTLDPIDGTKGFLRSEQYAVALALIVEGSPVVSVVGCPNLVDPLTGKVGQILSAVRGEGAFVLPLDEPQAPPRKISVSIQENLSSARMCESVESGHSAHDVSAMVIKDLGIGGEPVRLDSQAKYAVVALGEAELYLRLPTKADYREKIWDHAGGVLLVEEAGGTVTDVSGKPLEWTHGSELAANRGVIVSHGLWHPAVVESLIRHGVK